MKTITVMSCKGGSGKTTVAVNLAIAAHRAGVKTFIADCDSQRSATLSLQERKVLGPRCIPMSVRSLFDHGLKAESNGFELRIIDTPAAPRAYVELAVDCADLCLVVARPTFLDLAAVLTSAELIKQLGRSGAVVLNQTQPPRDNVPAGSVRRAVEAVALTRLPLATIISARVVYQQSLALGLSASEVDSPAGKREMDALWMAASNLLKTAALRPQSPERSALGA